MCTYHRSLVRHLAKGATASSPVVRAARQSGFLRDNRPPHRQLTTDETPAEMVYNPRNVRGGPSPGSLRRRRIP